MITVAALYIDPRGPYPTMPGVDCWDEQRDARTYAGPHPVVAHPPCERWGRYWYGGPMLHMRGERKKLGDDGGCFAAAIAAVRRWGGVLEHPEASHAWKHHGLRHPARSGGWTRTSDGWTCCVEQGHYGHRARKATWLFAVGVDPPDLRWGPSPAGKRLDQGFHSAEERRRYQRLGQLSGRLADRGARITDRERKLSPPAFAALLVELARATRRDQVDLAETG